MNAAHARLRSAASVLEILVGVALAGVGVYLLWDAGQCRPEASNCAPLAVLGAIVTLVPGCLVLAAGAVSACARRFSFWHIQLATVAAITVYFVGAYAILNYLAAAR